MSAPLGDVVGLSIYVPACPYIFLRDASCEVEVAADFLAEWRDGASMPVAEAVMISTPGSQGIPFVSRGVAVRTSGDGLRREAQSALTKLLTPAD